MHQEAETDWRQGGKAPNSTRDTVQQKMRFAGSTRGRDRRTREHQSNLEPTVTKYNLNALSSWSNHQFIDHEDSNTKAAVSNQKMGKHAHTPLPTSTDCGKHQARGKQAKNKYTLTNHAKKFGHQRNYSSKNKLRGGRGEEKPPLLDAETKLASTKILADK